MGGTKSKGVPAHAVRPWLSLWESWHGPAGAVTERVAAFRILKTLCKNQRWHPLRQAVRPATSPKGGGKWVGGDLRSGTKKDLRGHPLRQAVRPATSPKGGGKWVGGDLRSATKIPCVATLSVRPFGLPPLPEGEASGWYEIERRCHTTKPPPACCRGRWCFQIPFWVL